MSAGYGLVEYQMDQLLDPDFALPNSKIAPITIPTVIQMPTLSANAPTTVPMMMPMATMNPVGIF